MNLKSSILISIVSGAGLLAIVSLAPTIGENRENRIPVSEIRNNPFRRNLERAQKNPTEVGKPLLNLRIDPEELLRFSKQNEIGFRDVLGAGGFERSRSLDIQNFQWDRGFRNVREEFLKRSFYGKMGMMEFDAQISGIAPKEMYQEPIWGKYNRASFRNFVSPQSLDFLDLKVPISSSASAVFSFSSGDAFDGRNQASQFANYAFAGVQFKTNSVLSTRILAGDRYIAINRMNPSFKGSPTQEFRRMGWDERESTRLQSFEWQANLQPTKSIRLQTAIFNSPTERNWNSGTSLPDSGRMSLFLGEKNLFLNLRYTYQMSEQNQRNLLSSWQPKQDSASLGFLFFLDPLHSYSLYIGGNQFNIAERIQDTPNPNQSSKLPPSFTASLRGKTGASENSNFFVNFQNQPPGIWGLGIPAFHQGQNLETTSLKSFYEYATTLGLEVNF